MATGMKILVGWRLGSLSLHSSDRCLLSTSVPHLMLVEPYHSVPVCHKCERCEKVTSYPNRKFFNLPGNVSKKKEYCARKLVGYSREQMYDVVSDVKNYQDFVPFCNRSNVLLQQPNHIKANLMIGFPPLVENYTSNVTLEPPLLVKASCSDGKILNNLISIWRFSPGLKDKPQSCIIDFSLSFEFYSALHARIAHIFFNELVEQMERAFLTEARVRYGIAAVKQQKLSVVPTTRY